MFSKTPTDSPQGSPSSPRMDPFGPSQGATVHGARAGGQKLTSLIANDMTLEGNITGGGELQVDGVIKGDIRVERVMVSASGQVDGGIFAETVEVHGKVNGSISAKQVRLHDACHMDGDISHEQLAVEAGASFQGRSLRLQRPAAAKAAVSAQPAAGPSPAPQPAAAPPPPPAAAARPAEPPAPPRKDSPFQPRDNGNGLSPKP